MWVAPEGRREQAGEGEGEAVGRPRFHSAVKWRSARPFRSPRPPVASLERPVHIPKI